VYVATTSVTPDGRDKAWVVHAADPTKQVVRHYRVSGGSVLDAGSQTFMTGPPQPYLAALDSPELTKLIDSTRAVEVAESAGARAYRTHTGVSLRSMLLYFDKDRVPIWFVGYSKADSLVSISLELDARTGQVLLQEEAGAVKLRATPSAGPGAR